MATVGRPTTTQATSADIDYSKDSLEKILTALAVNPNKGLTVKDVTERLSIYGPNSIEEQEEAFWLKLVKHFMGPIAYMIEGAALISAIMRHWDDFIIISALLLFNVFIEMWQDHKASGALAALKNSLAPEATVLREGQWQTVPAKQLVPGDIVKIRLGMIVPADLRLVSGEFASIDQAALTGESLPVVRKIGDEAFSGSVVKQGEMDAIVIQTGENTFFGRTAKLVAHAGTTSHAQKAMFTIGNFLIVVAVILAAIMVAVRVYHDIVISDTWSMNDALSILQFVLVLLVASIPVAMPTVFSVTLDLGALALSKEKAIVSRLSAIEEMAGVDILCSDKTGTLTKNKLTLRTPILLEADTAENCILAASLASKLENNDAIDTAVIHALEDKELLTAWTIENFKPFDPVGKRTEATCKNKATGQEMIVTKGAPQVIAALIEHKDELIQHMNEIVAQLAEKGYRALAVAQQDCATKQWTLLGILPMFDPPRDDSKATIEEARRKGVSVKMITGDDTAIAIETARQLGMGTNIFNASEVFPSDMDPNHVSEDIADMIEKADGFARVYPEHKYAIVKALQNRGHLVAMTGDGVNDAPALKQADCGTAVAGATDAARGAAALILTESGLSVINTAIKEARKIFGRITSYTIYRVALTMTIMFLVVLSSIFLGFQPLTAIMIVVMSLMDDLPIMSIAYDRTEISPSPIRWKLSELLTTSSILGVVAIIQSFSLLLWGFEELHHPGSSCLHVTSFEELQTIMFLQLVSGGQLLLFITRSSKWFFCKPYPSPILFGAIACTQIIAIFMCVTGFLVQSIPLSVIAIVWCYNLLWLFVLGAVRKSVEKYMHFRGERQLKNQHIVNMDLRR